MTEIIGEFLRGKSVPDKGAEKTAGNIDTNVLQLPPPPVKTIEGFGDDRVVNAQTSSTLFVGNHHQLINPEKILLRYLFPNAPEEFLTATPTGNDVSAAALQVYESALNLSTGADDNKEGRSRAALEKLLSAAMTSLITTEEGEDTCNNSATIQHQTNSDSDPTYITISIAYSTNSTDIIDLQVTKYEMVQELHQILMEREETYNRTCFSLYHEGQKLDQYSELKSISGLKDNSVLKLNEESYTLREVRLHIKHLREIFNTLDLTDAFNGNEGASVTYVDSIIGKDNLSKYIDVASERSAGNNKNSIWKKIVKENNASLEESLTDETLKPTDYLLPYGNNNAVPVVPFMPLHPLDLKEKAMCCLKSISFNHWNPPPGPRKLKGDLAYLTIMTLENKEFQVTACTRGFYINQSMAGLFNPLPQPDSQTYHSIFDLISKISPCFKRNIGLLVKKRISQNTLEKAPLPIQKFCWILPYLEHKEDCYRAEDNGVKVGNGVSTTPSIFENMMETRLGFEDQIPGQTRDWNEELQATRELPRNDLLSRVSRDRAIFKVGSDFIGAAVKGALSLTQGNALPINPGESSKMHMYIWNNIFYSLGFDIRDHYKEFGGDDAAHVAPANDLKGVELYSDLDMEKLHTLGTVVIDYRGLRITGQTIIPGILEREQEELVVYGSIDPNPPTNTTTAASENPPSSNKRRSFSPPTLTICPGGERITLRTNPEYDEILKEAARKLRIRSHTVYTPLGSSLSVSETPVASENEMLPPPSITNSLVSTERETVQLHTSYECKGIIGNDRRHYILDLYRTLPPDLNFLPTKEYKLSGYSRRLGLPHINYKHGLAILRPELIEALTEYVFLIKNINSTSATIDTTLVESHRDSSLVDRSESSATTDSLFLPKTQTGNLTTTTNTQILENEELQLLTPHPPYDGIIYDEEIINDTTIISAGGNCDEMTVANKSADNTFPGTTPQSYLASDEMTCAISMEDGKAKCDSSNEDVLVVSLTTTESSSVFSSDSSNNDSNNKLNQLLHPDIDGRSTGNASHTSSSSDDKDSAIESMDIQTPDGSSNTTSGDEDDDEEEEYPNSAPAADTKKSSNASKTQEQPSQPHDYKMNFRTKFPISMDDLRFNPDAFLDIVEHDKSHSSKLKMEKEMLMDAADFVVCRQIPDLVDDFFEISSIPIDGESLIESMHSKGINVRYLGIILKMIEHQETKQDELLLSKEITTNITSHQPKLKYLKNIIILELISRSVKHIFRKVVQDVSTEHLSAMIAHFLNCYLGYIIPNNTSCFNNNNSHNHVYSLSSQLPDLANYKSGVRTKKGKKKRGGHNNNINHVHLQNMDWIHLTSNTLWQRIVQDVETSYVYKIKKSCDDTTFTQYAALKGLKKSLFLRQFCLKCGVQIVLREYSVTSVPEGIGCSNKQLSSSSYQTNITHSPQAPSTFCAQSSPNQQVIFVEDDILNLYPKIKHVSQKANDAHKFFIAGQAKIQGGYLKDGFELLSEALNLMNTVYGPIHSEVTSCLRLIARLSYILGDKIQALSFQHKSTIMSERLHGIDHSNTIIDYINLALYYVANLRIGCALRLLYRARYLLLIVAETDHPEFIALDSNLGLVLYANGMYDESMAFLDNALRLCTIYHGVTSLKTAVIYHLIAGVYSCKGDFRTAIVKEKKAFSIYKEMLGENHEKTLESGSCLRHLTQQAVAMQKCIFNNKNNQNSDSLNHPSNTTSTNTTNNNRTYCGSNSTNHGTGNSLTNVLTSVPFLPSLHIQKPSLSAILDLMNAINGILFVQIKPCDYEKLTETERQLFISAAQKCAASSSSTLSDHPTN